MGMTVDFKEFEKRINELVTKVEPRETARALFETGNMLIQDAIKQKPYAPFDEGHLRGSARTEPAEVKRGAVEVACGFNIEYAARWHELTPAEDAKISWTLPGSGRKYLEAKLANPTLREKYMRYIAGYFEDALRRG